ncbi:MAG: dihydroorotate dehydrogenase electron transfer subunit [Oscillospiraceae bacterium]|jgi:dihydroorotate dehydrogenase electron transfer subunit|nr:dihydroorotate dehydrogenase electron transfer subunit [Oscillospiraceae bacterium]
MSCKVTFTEELRDGVFALSFTAAELTPPKPGQFVHIKCAEDGGARILRRPVSVCDFFGGGDGAEPELTVVFEVRGGGTKWLSERREDDELDVLGALGSGFPEVSGDILLAGGGLGIAPLLYAAQRAGTRAEAVLGFRSKERIILTGDFERLARRVEIATDDGSYGHGGTVAEPVRAALAERPFGAVFACGPRPMLRAVAEIAEERGVPCFVSLEERMACGVGACLGCAVKLKTADGEAVKRVCRDGPVFASGEVVW